MAVGNAGGHRAHQLRAAFLDSGYHPYGMGETAGKPGQGNASVHVGKFFPDNADIGIDGLHYPERLLGVFTVVYEMAAVLEMGPEQGNGVRIRIYDEDAITFFPLHKRPCIPMVCYSVLRLRASPPLRRLPRLRR